jgi:hypothetical protein
MFCIDEYRLGRFEFSNTHEMYLTPRFCVASPLNGYQRKKIQLGMVILGTIAEYGSV